MKQKKYIEHPGRGIGIWTSNEWEPVFTGTHVDAMPISFKNPEYDSFAENYDIIFLFEDDVVEVGFYAVPQLWVFARDSVGGFFAECDREVYGGQSPSIVYVSEELQCYLVADSMENFIDNPGACVNGKKATDQFRLFRNKAEACAMYEIKTPEELLAEAERNLV